jgi:hypothetical protein
MKQCAAFVRIGVCCLLWSITVGAVTDSNYTKGMEFLRKGNGKEAAINLEKAYRAHPSSAQITYDYAGVAPCSLSLALFTKLASDTKAPDTLRAAAYRQLGDYSFIHSAFKTAMEKYRLAASLHADPLYDHCRARAAAAMNDTAVAKPLWRKLAAQAGGDNALQAHYQLALLDMKAGMFDSAFNRLGLIGGIDSARSLTVAAAAAKLECALRLGKKDSAAVLEKKLRPFDGKLLESGQLNLASVLRAPVKKTAAAPGTEAAGESSGEYTLQVGAFGSLDNATALQKKLLARYADVSILPVTMAENVFYRVRIGMFKSKAAAETFAVDSLMPSGVGYKVVVK